jgi:hypothetical protein
MFFATFGQQNQNVRANVENPAGNRVQEGSACGFAFVHSLRNAWNVGFVASA